MSDSNFYIRVSDSRDGQIGPREMRAANSSDMSTGARLGIVHRYGYGESRPELRPLVEGE